MQKQIRSEPTAAPERFPFRGYPKGWFVVALSEDVPPGRVVTMRYFGRDLIAYRGESGRVYVMDAYCPHLGAHLGHGGAIEGESLRCPFHGWRFEGDGRCVEVPYSTKIPPRAAIDAFPVREQNGVVLVFHDPAGGEPWELPVLDEEGWTPGRSVVWRALRTHPQEVFENTVDMAHIGPIHGGRGAALIGRPVRDGVRMDVELEFQASGEVVGMPDQINDVCLRVSLLGLGHVVVATHVRNVDVRARQRIYATPIDRDSIDLRGIVHVRESDDPAFTAELAGIFYKAYVEDFAKDFPIWENKRYLVRPQLTAGDGPIGLYRQWCAQFYESEPRQVAPDVPRDDLVSKVRRVAGLVQDRVRGALSVARERVPVASASAEEPKREPVASNGSANKTEPSPSPAPATLRVASVEEYLDTLEQRFVPSAAAGVDAVFQWELAGEGGDVFHAHVRDGHIEVKRGPHAQPTVALVMDAADYVRVVNGELDGTWAFTSGKGKVKGSLTAAMKMRSLFPA